MESINNPVIIDKSTYKIMRYMYKHQNVTLSKIRKKFGTDGISHALFLCPAHYAVYRTLEGEYTYNISHTCGSGAISLTALGNEYVERRRNSFLMWAITTEISFLALLVSVVSLIISIL